jgi:hypothetical protein
MSDPLTAGQCVVRGLRGDTLLEGQHEASAVLRPDRMARPVVVDDPGAVHTEVTRLSQVWGARDTPCYQSTMASCPMPTDAWLAPRRSTESAAYNASG